MLKKKKKQNKQVKKQPICTVQNLVTFRDDGASQSFFIWSKASLYLSNMSVFPLSANKH